MRNFGLIGYPLSHSFSKKYFTEKFGQLGLSDHRYDLFEMEDISHFPKLWEDAELIGVNVTVPHKQNVMTYLDALDASAEKVGAVNVIKRQDGRLVGYNSDYYGFSQSLENWIPAHLKSALVLGTGGASKAVKVALSERKIIFKMVSRSAGDGVITYHDLNMNPSIFQASELIVNTTPLGTYPKVELKPELPYHLLSANHYLFDLVYNPAETAFLKEGKSRGAYIKNGYEMLVWQAEKSWEIWQNGI